MGASCRERKRGDREVSNSKFFVKGLNKVPAEACSVCAVLARAHRQALVKLGF